jgi:hypothetical protein
MEKAILTITDKELAKMSDDTRLTLFGAIRYCVQEMYENETGDELGYIDIENYEVNIKVEAWLDKSESNDDLPFYEDNAVQHHFLTSNDVENNEDAHLDQDFEDRISGTEDQDTNFYGEHD